MRSIAIPRHVFFKNAQYKGHTHSSVERILLTNLIQIFVTIPIIKTT